ncbi:type II toxin-antitoxin system HicA family toxin [Nocardia nova]|uniref:type II toxin-antitoxin system HicA family toxin n=1 Tax=Nocardia nova TaxID=37330 RepID=UPI001B34CE58|nr:MULTISPECIES: type II toxin-antitoxin system HicA family toxin [Nocardia]MBV7702478.1 type II toxin-antitoxin system HicA family toxin [Nocardia nova]
MVISEQPTRTILQELIRSGWSRKRQGKGSHSLWQCPTGQHSVTVPDGHTTIRAGVVRSIRKAVDGCSC